MVEPKSIALVVLAAGASQRMGRPKQLLVVDGEPLVRRVVRRLSDGFVGEVVVVLGANAAEVAKALDGLPVRTVVNEAWAEGMGSSLRCGVEAALGCGNELSAVLIALGDQPTIRSAHLARLREEWRGTGRPVVASESDGVLMPPVLFAAAYFPKLLELAGDAGARALLRHAGEDLAVVPAGPMPDLDTPEAYEAYLRANRLTGASGG